MEVRVNALAVGINDLSSPERCNVSKHRSEDGRSGRPRLSTARTAKHQLSPKSDPIAWRHPRDGAQRNHHPHLGHALDAMESGDRESLTHSFSQVLPRI